MIICLTPFYSSEQDVSVKGNIFIDTSKFTFVYDVSCGRPIRAASKETKLFQVQNHYSYYIMFDLCARIFMRSKDRALRLQNQRSRSLSTRTQTSSFVSVLETAQMKMSL